MAGWYKQKRSHTHNPLSLTLWNAAVNVHLHLAWGPPGCSSGERYKPQCVQLGNDTTPMVLSWGAIQLPSPPGVQLGSDTPPSPPGVQLGSDTTPPPPPNPPSGVQLGSDTTPPPLQVFSWGAIQPPLPSRCLAGEQYYPPPFRCSAGERYNPTPSRCLVGEQYYPPLQVFIWGAIQPCPLQVFSGWAILPPLLQVFSWGAIQPCPLQVFSGWAILPPSPPSGVQLGSDTTMPPPGV